MNVYPSDEYISDEDLFQDMEEHLYNPLPSDLVERDWLEPLEIEPSWMELPEMERGWLDLPEIERDWLNTPDMPEHDHEEHNLQQIHDIDFDI